MSTLRRVLVVGAGGLGCPVLLGLGPDVRLTIVDHDRVEVSNLQRQILHRTTDVGRFKAESAAEALGRRWPGSAVEPRVTRLDPTNAHDLVSTHDVIIDGTDSFDAKFLLNDVCCELSVPLVHGAVLGLTGQLMTVMPGTACYRCIFEAPPLPGAAASCQEAGVLGAVCGVIGGRMAREAKAVLVGAPTLAGTLLVFDGLRNRWRSMTPRPRAACPAHRAPEVATW